MTAIREPAHVARPKRVRESDGVSFSGAHNTQKETSPVGKRQVFAVRGDCGAEDGVILRIAGQAALGEANRGRGTVARVPAGTNSGEQNRSHCQWEPPATARLGCGTALLLCSRRGWGGRNDFLRRSVDWSDETVASAR